MICGDGQQVRDFTFVGAVVSVLADAVLGGVTSPEPVNLAFGTRTTIADLAQRVVAVVGVAAEVRYAPPRAGDVRDSQAESNRLRALFPGAAPTDLDEGLKQTVAWFREHQGRSGAVDTAAAHAR